jgi:hypothetical protein
MIHLMMSIIPYVVISMYSVRMRCFIIAKAPFGLLSFAGSSIEVVAFSINGAVMGIDNDEFLPCCGEPFCPYRLILLRQCSIKTISLSGDPDSNVNNIKTLVPFTFICFRCRCSTGQFLHFCLVSAI